jgi:hypothetical protein
MVRLLSSLLTLSPPLSPPRRVELFKGRIVPLKVWARRCW